MKWNWQKSDWPNFSWDRQLLLKAEELFLLKAGVFVGAVKHLSSEDQDQLNVEVMSTEALSTSEIEGEILDRSSVQSSICRQLGLKTDQRHVRPAEQGIAEMMVNLYRSYATPLTNQILYSWHRSLMKGRSDIKAVGNYRTHKEPMQVISGSVATPRVHFEAPPSTEVPSEMTRFVAWFNRTQPQGKEPLPTLTRAGIAHLYFVSIHPFEDGNGRIARGISEKSLAQNIGQAAITGLAASILSKRKSYYEALEAANKNNEISDWLIWFAETAIAAQQQTTGKVEFLISKTKLLDRLRGQLNERQEKVLLRVLKEGPAGFKGGLSAGNYISITKASPATATRDLVDLIDRGVFRRVGERRHARYHVLIPLRQMAPVIIDKFGNVKI